LGLPDDFGVIFRFAPNYTWRLVSWHNRVDGCGGAGRVLTETLKIMKAFALLLVLAGLICGCAQRYKITYHNRQEMTTSSRPKFDDKTATYRFKDDMGQEVIIPGFRVKQIEPL
jgi:hypothetical protein